HSLTELVMVALLAVGLSTGVNTPTVTNVVAVFGGALLLWMALFMVQGALSGRLALPAADESARPLGNWQLIGLGIGATLVNPFWYGWWLTVAAAYVFLSQNLGWTGVLVFYLGHISADFLWDSVLSGVVGRGRRWITDRFYKWLMVGCGVYLTYLGVIFIAAPFANPQ
ncbi:MAG: LysE family transporter, partial [Anaerolineales bacterium]